MAKAKSRKKKFPQVVKIQQDKENPEPMELVAKSIITISDAFERANKAGLTERAIALLLNDATGIPMGDIRKILSTAPRLKEIYLK